MDCREIQFHTLNEKSPGGVEQMEKLNYDTIKTYQSFTTIEELDQSVRGFLYKFKSSLSDGTVKVLHFIWKYSVKVVGVSFAKYDTIAEGVGLSRRTVIRAVKTLEDGRFIKKIPTARMNGKQGVNLYVILPFESIDSLLQPVSPQDVTEPVTPNKAKNKQSPLCENKKQNRYVEKKASQANCHCVEPCRETLTTEENPNVSDSKSLSYAKVSKKQNLALNPIINRQSSVTLKHIEGKTFDTSFLPDYVNKDFIQAAQPFFNTEDIYKLWSRIHLAYKKVDLLASLGDVMEPILTDFKKVIFMYKMGKIKTTFEGYFYQVIYTRL